MVRLRLAQQVRGVWGWRENKVTHRTQLGIVEEARQWAGSECVFVCDIKARERMGGAKMGTGEKKRNG